MKDLLFMLPRPPKITHLGDKFTPQSCPIFCPKAIYILEKANSPSP
jgi:hypothetical protein